MQCNTAVDRCHLLIDLLQHFLRVYVCDHAVSQQRKANFEWHQADVLREQAVGESIVFNQPLKLLYRRGSCFKTSGMTERANKDGRDGVALKSTDGGIQGVFQAGIEALGQQLVDVDLATQNLYSPSQNVAHETWHTIDLEMALFEERGKAVGPWRRDGDALAGQQRSVVCVEEHAPR